jgi:cell division septation protein DedD
MPSQDNSKQGSPFEVVTTSRSRRVGGKGVVITVVVIVFLVISVAAGVYFVRQQQNIQEKAAVSLCPSAEQCPVPGQGDLLLSCNPSNADGTPAETSCSNVASVGLITTCGTQRFCCPSLGASWTTDVALCSTPTPTPVATPTPQATVTPTATASATPTATATASATPTAQATPRSIPVSGVGWPTIVGVGVGVGVIVVSVLLAL